jgi:lipid A oxidase
MQGGKVSMTGILTIGWTGGRDHAGAASLIDKISALAAAVLLTASTAATVLEQSALDSGPDAAASSSSGAEPSTLPTKETMVGAFGGAPYTYPSPVHIHKTGAEDFTIDPVHWKGDPFHNPIYYGARVIRWLTGGRAGVMLDFIHSKAMAELDKQASFSGQIDGKPLPAEAKIKDIVKKLEFSHGHNMLLLTGLMRLPGIGARLSPYVGAGVGALLPHAEVGLTAPGHPRTYEYNYAGPAGQALAGLEVRLARMSLFIEYKYTYGKYDAPLSQVDGSWLGADLWRELQRWMKGEEPPGGHINTDIISHQVVGGLAVRFAAHPATP